MKPKNYFLSMLLIPLCLQMAACKSDSSEPQAAATPVQAPHTESNNDNSNETEGGISAGGGGTLPADPIAEYQIWQVLETAKMQLRLYINYRRFFSDNMDPYFGGDQNLATVLEKTDLEVLTTGACKDANGHEVDASIHASKPNAICLSIPRIQPKLIKEIANKEILALLVHELTHLLGANEAEAVQAQKSAVFYFGELSATDLERLENTMWGMAWGLPSFSSIQSSIQTASATLDYQSVLENLRSIRKTFSDTAYLPETSPLFNLPLSLLDFRQKDYLEYLEFKVRLAESFVAKLQDPSSGTSDSFGIEKCFQDSDELTLAELKTNCPGFDSGTTFDNLKIKRLKNISELPAYLNDAILAGTDLEKHVRAIAFTQPLPHFNFPGDLEKENSFSKYVGVYSVREVGCASTWTNGYNAHKGLTALEINNAIETYPIEMHNVVNMKKTFENMQKSLNVYDGGGQYAMFVSGDATSAKYTEEQGTRWHDRQSRGWSQETFQIQEVNGKLMLTMMTEGFRESPHIKPWEAYQSCQYELIKQ